jgi:hypothetical protein
MIISKDDFTGLFKLAKSTELNKVIDATIERYEKEYVYKVLGVALGDLFWADCQAGTNGVPTDPIYLAIYNSFTYQDATYRQNYCDWDYFPYYFAGQTVTVTPLAKSCGMKELLLRAVYYEYTRLTTLMSSGQAGLNMPGVDAATTASSTNSIRYAELQYNEMLPSWDAIQWFVGTKNKTDYPDYVQPEYFPEFKTSSVY